MNVTTISRSLLGGLLSAIVILQPVSAAGTLSGQIGVQVTLGSGCSVSNVRNGENNRWGNINFGAYGDLANSIDAEITGSGGGSALTVTCTEDLASTLTLDGGQSGDPVNVMGLARRGRGVGRVWGYWRSFPAAQAPFMPRRPPARILSA